MDLKMLAEPFPSEDIEWRAGALMPNEDKCLALAYVTNRAIMNRLDEVCDPDGWSNNFEAWRAKGVLCGITIYFDGGIGKTKYDGADESNIESTKGGFSDSMKRAAVQWGIGRYLYKLPAYWVKCTTYNVGGKRKVGKLLETPALPEWARPEGDTTKSTSSHVASDSKPSSDKPNPSTKKVSEGQLKRLYAIRMQKGLSEEAVKKNLKQKWNFDKELEELPVTTYNELCDGMNKMDDKGTVKVTETPPEGDSAPINLEEDIEF